MLQYASEELRRDREVALAAVAQSGNALQNVSKEQSINKPTINNNI